MPKRKRKKNILPIKLSASPDGRERTFAIVGRTYAESPQCKNLGYGARHLLTCMSIKAASGNEFTFTKHDAERFGYPESSLRRFINELIDAHFIEIVQTEDPFNMWKPNVYRFTNEWKNSLKNDTIAYNSLPRSPRKYKIKFRTTGE